MGNRGGMPGDVLLLNSRPSSSAKNNLNSTSFISMNRTQRIYDFTEEIQSSSRYCHGLSVYSKIRCNCEKVLFFKFLVIVR